MIHKHAAFDGKVFAFKGKYLWRIKNNGAASGFPKKITSFYKRAPSNVDAVVTSRVNQKTYIFKGISDVHVISFSMRIFFRNYHLNHEI